MAVRVSLSCTRETQNVKKFYPSMEIKYLKNENVSLLILTAG